jgi:hypothetical protein
MSQAALDVAQKLPCKVHLASAMRLSPVGGELEKHWRVEEDRISTGPLGVESR